MIGRFARGMGDRPVAPLAAGLILVAIGLWNSSELLLPAYPGESDLESFSGEAVDAIVVMRQRGALVRFLQGSGLELQAALDPGERLVLYTNDMPNYEAVKTAVAAGPAVYGLWPDAPSDEDRHRIWSLSASDGQAIVTRDETVSGLQAVRQEAAVIPAIIGLAGLVVAGFAVRRWRRRSA